MTDPGRKVGVLVVCDSFLPREIFEGAFAGLGGSVALRLVQLDETRAFAPASDAEQGLREYAGSPEQLIEELDGHEVLVVHAAPVTEAVLAASPKLRLVCCARGGPVNVDVGAATRRGILVATSPGRNHRAVAELTIALMIMLARSVPRAQACARRSPVLGRSAFEGAPFFGRELFGRTLGLVGFGRVGSTVAALAGAFGMSVLAYDPYVDDEALRREGAARRELHELLAASDFVSLHARATPETENLIGPAEFAAMKPDSYLVNTARETLIDEHALERALASGRLGGAAFDVVRPRPEGERSPLLEYDNAIVLPHIGGATVEAGRLGARISAGHVERFVAGRQPEHVVNRQLAATTPRSSPGG